MNEFELTNAQRACFGLVPVEETWERFYVKTSHFDHFTAMILNLPFDFEGLKKLSSYYYDDLGGNDNIKKVFYLNECIKINYPLCLLYMRDYQNYLIFKLF